MRINFYELGQVDEESMKFVVISSRYEGKWVFVRHKQRDSWEIPGGHIEKGESIDDAAKRELFEETGAADFDIRPIFDYSVTVDNHSSFGRLYISRINELGELPDMEIGEVRLFEELPDELTYPLIQPHLHQKVISLL